MNMVQSKIKHNEQSCCSNPQYEHHDLSDRRFRTSVGKVIIRWHRLKCTNCGKTVIPLREFLGLELYQSKTSELEKPVAEVVSEQSYRRSSNHLESIGSTPVPKSTAHRWVVQSECDRIDTGQETFDLLLADRTHDARAWAPSKTNGVWLERRRSREDGKNHYQAFHFSRPVGKILARQAENSG